MRLDITAGGGFIYGGIQKGGTPCGGGEVFILGKMLDTGGGTGSAASAVRSYGAASCSLVASLAVQNHSNSGKKNINPKVHKAVKSRTTKIERDNDIGRPIQSGISPFSRAA